MPLFGRFCCDIDYFKLNTLVKSRISLDYVISYFLHIASRLHALLFLGVFGQLGGRWQVRFVGRCQVSDLGGTWTKG